MVLKIVKLHQHEVGLHFQDGEFRGLLEAGRHWFFDPLGHVRVDVVSQRAPRLALEKLDVIVKSGALDGKALVLDLKDYERALLWIDGRFSHVVPPGLYAYWTTFCKVKAEIVDARTVRFVHADLPVIVKSPQVERVLESVAVPASHEGVCFRDGSYVESAAGGPLCLLEEHRRRQGCAGRYACLYRRVAGRDHDGRQGNAALERSSPTASPTRDCRSASPTPQQRSTARRSSCCALWSGARELDSFLTDIDGVVQELEQNLPGACSASGLEIVTAGIRDIILPGEMKDLLNKVMEARKAAEANLISKPRDGGQQPGQHGQAAAGQPDAHAPA